MSMSNWYLKLTGKLQAAIGRLDKYSDEHRGFLSSGYECPRCKQTLMRWWGVADVVCLRDNGEKVSLAIARIKGKEFQCPKCRHKWKLRST